MPQALGDDELKRIEEMRSGQEERVVADFARDIGLSYVDLSGMGIDTNALGIIPETEARSLGIAGFELIGMILSIAVLSPAPHPVQDKVKALQAAGYTVKQFLASQRSLEKAWGRYADISRAMGSRRGLLDISPEALADIAAHVTANIQVTERIRAIASEPDTHQVTRILETMFGSAIALGASDVHIEPQETQLRIRFREDGVLQDVAGIEPVLGKRIESRLKLLAELKLTATASAQDGRFTITYNGQEIEIRVSTVPGPYGEGIVMRILNPDSIALSFEQLGIEPHLLKQLESQIKKPNGMILTTGPTGSGKTTTLYAFLKYIYTPEIKVITIEDPIEYHLTGISQTQVEHDKGYDFVSGLRAALRQDPDIIMVGEIRDTETATVAVNSALTGHLVFSTLHTNNAAGTIPRLLDLGVKPGILASALTVSIAQRLIRRLCPYCKVPSQLSSDDESLMREILAHAERIGKDLSPYKLTSDGPLAAYEARGCDKCNGSGFKGRVGLYEAIMTDDVIADLMAKSPTEKDIKRAADKQLNFTLTEDAVIKVATGITALSEVTTVIDLTEDRTLRKESKGLRGAPVITVEDMTAGRMKQPEPEAKHIGHIMQAPAQAPGTSWNAHELQLLVDYLKLLEMQQEQHPSAGISHKIEDVQKTILEIMKSGNLDDLGGSTKPAEMVAREVAEITDALEDLKVMQETSPDVSVAHQLAAIRTQIESLRQ
jgi:type II secretory ATPase GspE/PulE/Tfp pilus assembly ATPase PilB-like protein